jgi:methionyl-tRNA formyltransferase
MGSDAIALPLLEVLWKAQGPTQLVGVFTQPDKPKGRGQRVASNPIKQWALDRNIQVLQPHAVGQAEADWVQTQGIQMAWVMAYGHILKQVFLDALPLGAWNLHASLLPKYRGAAPIEAALMAGEARSGVTLMRMVRRMDAGPVVDQAAFECLTLTQAQARLAMGQAAAALVNQYHDALCLQPQGIEPVPQNEEAATYVGKLSKADGRLDFSRTAPELERQVRALSTWPGCYCYWGELLLKVGQACVINPNALQGADPGTVLGLHQGALVVAAGQGTLLGLTQLQRPFGKMLAASAFLCGSDIPQGTCLT